jgi:hypothetical protein
MKPTFDCLFGMGLGAHIPDMSSEVEFFDILYLGVFVTLSSAFDRRFYNGKTPSSLMAEIGYAVQHFRSLLHRFSLRFILLLDGEPVSHKYLVDRMVAEFAAASVVFSKATDVSEDGGRCCDEEKGGVTTEMMQVHVEGILRRSHKKAFAYYSRCLDRRHKHFLWTGPKVHILPRSDDIASLIPFTCKGEKLDLPSPNQIYSIDVDAVSTSTPASSQLEYRCIGGSSSDIANEQTRKRRRVNS